uniref:Endoplasmic reticulum lectin n=1 Tax=Oncorhynchus tshawytscha TaxID=74940 RepID=A0AAZ3PKH3_ONCTS
MDRTRLLFVLFGGLSELCCHVSANRGGSPSFSDEIPFKINWPGDEFTLPTSGALYKDDDFVIMTTTEKEKYKCLLPSLSNGDDDDVKEYAGPTPGDLLDPLFKQSSCSYREESMSPVREEAFSSTHKPLVVGGQTHITVGTTHISRLTDEQLIKEFLSGSYCLHGGVGWWKYEFCYGKHVHQYHEDKEQGKNMVVVGSWNTEEHLEWAQKNVARSYQLKNDGVQKVKLVSHFYGHGDVCDMTGKPRQVIVKLKCKESASPHAVTVYMLEPQTCQYVLGVESPVICQILDTADEKGLLSVSS